MEDGEYDLRWRSSMIEMIEIVKEAINGYKYLTVGNLAPESKARSDFMTSWS